MNGSSNRRDPLPPLPDAFRGELRLPPSDLTPWFGASGPFWSPPRGVIRPATREDVCLAAVWATENGVRLIPRGGGSGMPGGNVGREVVVDLGGLRRIDGPDRRDSGAPGLLRADAGAMGSDLRAKARSVGGDLPALPSSARWATLGGMVACNAAGARSFRYGAAGAWVREVEWVRADGRVEDLLRGVAPGTEWSSLLENLRGVLPDPLPWPRVRKNSSGYALDRFLSTGNPVDLAVGSEGTLGIITAATLELQPLPEACAVVVAGVPDLDFMSGVARAARSMDGVVACEYFGRRLVEMGGLHADGSLDDLRLTEGMLLLEVAGDPDTVSRARSGVEALCRPGGYRAATDPVGMEALWEFRHAASPTIGRALARGLRSIQFIEDSVVPVDRLDRYVQGVREILGRHGTDAVIFGHAGDGNLHVNPLVDLRQPGWRESVRAILEDTVALVAELGGTLAGEHGDGRLRTPFLHRIFAPEVVRAFGTVKASLDPSGTLNPGVKVPLPNADPLSGLGDAPEFAAGSQGPERVERGR